MDKLDQGDLYERAAGIGRKAAQRTYDDIYGAALVRLLRSKPIIDILQLHNIPPFIGPIKQRGFCVLIQEEEPGFISHIEKVACKSLDTGTLLYPSRFGEYADRLKAATQYQETLAIHEIKSEIIHLPNPGTEEDMAVLFVPYFGS